MTCNYLIVCCVDTGRDSVVMKREADSNDITEYEPHYKPCTGMFYYLSFHMAFDRLQNRFASVSLCTVCVCVCVCAHSHGHTS